MGETIDTTLRTHLFDDLKHYSRRADQILMIIGGFGLFGSLEFLKLILEYKVDITTQLSISGGLFTISIIFGAVVIFLEKYLRQRYISISIYDEKESHKKSVTLERWVMTLSFFQILSLSSGLICFGWGAYSFINLIQ